MKFELKPYHRNVSNEELIADIKRVAVALRKNSVTIDEYNDRGNYHHTTLTRRFGCWFKVLAICGLDPTRSPLNIPEIELFQNLEKVWIRLGRQPRYVEIQKPLSKFHSKTYENHFGSWTKALERFVEYVNQEQNISSVEAFEKLPIDKTSRHKTKRNVNSRLRVLVMMRDNSKCKICGRSPDTDKSIIIHVDHIKPWSKGGETVLENLQTLCSKCNLGKSDLE
jgi:5-methylcytosine-specific restriction endonuclease McrA